MKLTPPEENGTRGARARLYIRWMPHIGAEAVALYELLRILPDVGQESVEAGELAELLRSTPANVEKSFETLVKNGFIVERGDWAEVAEHPPNTVTKTRRPKEQPREAAEERTTYRSSRDVEVVRAEQEGVSADDYFKYMGSLPAPHILEFLNGYCERDGFSPDVVREALRIASERGARQVGYVRGIMERWVERGVKTLKDVELFEKDRKLRLVEEGGSGKGVNDGENRQSAARRREGYEWLFGETE